MPLYDFKCGKSGTRFERRVPLAQFEEVQFCACGCVANRVISAPRFSVDNVGYDCPVTGKWIGSKREHEENLKRTDSRVLEPGEKEANQRTRAAQEAAFEKAVDETVERTIDGYSSAKKEQLANELCGGADVAVERK